MPRRARKAHRGTVLILLTLAAVFAQQWVAGMLQPVDPHATQTVSVEIPTGALAPAIADLLYQKQLIRSPWVFRYYARFRGLDSALKSGEYAMNKAMTPAQILQKLAQGDVVAHEFTIPEGFTVEQMADRLSAMGIVNREKFLQAARTSKLAAAYLPAHAPVKYPVEGYLFPATYQYRQGVTETDILAMMFERFEEAWTSAMRDRLKADRLTIHEAVTLASIVEREAKVPAERAVIAGVYQNRLSIGMKLDADPTVRYALDKPVAQDLTGADLKVDDPFNTYRSAGLPPGPIASPGLASIQAALSPQKNDFWYFVAKGDGSGEHYFARTLDEQDQHIDLARANAAKQK